MNLSTGSEDTAWSAAAALMCMIYSLGDVSGGHFNPAVTTGLMLTGQRTSADGEAAQVCTLLDGCAYIATQVAGGISAGLLYQHFHAVGPVKDKSFYLGPQDQITWHQVAAAETTFTALLMFVVLCMATNPKVNTRFYFALAIG